MYTEEEKEAVRKLFKKLDDLSAKERFVFIEYYYFETHMQSLADILKVRHTGVYSILNRAIKKIKEGLTKREASNKRKNTRQYGDMRGKRKIYQEWDAHSKLKTDAREVGVNLTDLFMISNLEIKYREE